MTSDNKPAAAQPFGYYTVTNGFFRHADEMTEQERATCIPLAAPASAPEPSITAIQVKQADARGDEALARAHKLEEALEYLFLAIVTRADSDYLFRAINRADEALRVSMPGWTPPVPMTGWQAAPPVPAAAPAGEPTDVSKRLIEIARHIESLKRECGMDPESPIALHNGALMSASLNLRDLAKTIASPVPKPLDDPRLQELFSSAITGALAFGAQGNNKPPEGHWLMPFWEMARAERSASPEPASRVEGDKP